MSTSHCEVSIWLSDPDILHILSPSRLPDLGYWSLRNIVTTTDETSPDFNENGSQMSKEISIRQSWTLPQLPSIYITSVVPRLTYVNGSTITHWFEKNIYLPNFFLLYTLAVLEFFSPDEEVFGQIWLRLNPFHMCLGRSLPVRHVGYRDYWVISNIKESDRQSSIFISNFLSCCSTGIFFLFLIWWPSRHIKN